MSVKITRQPAQQVSKSEPPEKDTLAVQLSACLRILSGFGKIGERIWKLGKWYVGELEDGQYKKRKTHWTQVERLDYLKQAILHIREKATSKTIRYTELPVDFRTFCESPEYLNKPNILWPRVIEHGVKINSGKYVEAVLTGAIGVAKTTLALYSQSYQTYALACMLEPHETFDLDPSSEILIVLQSLNKNVAQDVDYKRLRDMISNSPWFTENFQFRQDRETDMRFPRNIIIKPVSGHDTAAIGQNVIGGIIDEINFMAVVEKSKMANDGQTYDQATQNYNSISSRRNSRFMQLGGGLPGMLCLVSSRNYPGQFTDKKEEQAKTNKQIYIYDQRIWELRPERFGFHNNTRSEIMEEKWGKDYPFWFYVFIGDNTRKPRIVESKLEFKPEDWHLVHEIPIEFKHKFIEDLLTQLREVAGVATQAMHPFMMNTDAIATCFGVLKSVASRTTCDFDGMQLDLYPRRFINPDTPRFAHLDLSESKDSTGIAIGHIPKFVEIDRGEDVEVAPVIHYDLILEVQPPKGGEIDYARIRKLLYQVRRHTNLKWVSADTYQSSDMIKILAQQGFITGVQSMDTDNIAYDMLKQAIYDGRVAAHAHDKAQLELSQLELVPKSGEIDHPPNGSKDLADAMAGVCYGLSQRKELWVRHGIAARRLPKRLLDQAKTANKKSISYIETLRQERMHDGVGGQWNEGNAIPFPATPTRRRLRNYA